METAFTEVAIFQEIFLAGYTIISACVSLRCCGNSNGLDGFEVARRLRQDPTLSSTPLFALTGYNPDLQLNAEAGFHDYFTKPVNLVRLQCALQQISAKSASPGPG
jgi:CheY-like chemotaxis protein